MFCGGESYGARRQSQHGRFKPAAITSQSWQVRFSVASAVREEFC